MFKKLLLILAVLGLISGGIVLASTLMTFHNTITIQAPPPTPTIVLTYWLDSSCNTSAVVSGTNVDWGTVTAGNNAQGTIYIKNTGTASGTVNATITDISTWGVFSTVGAVVPPGAKGVPLILNIATKISAVGAKTFDISVPID